MAIYFIDSSALVKHYIRETGSVWVSGLFDHTLNNEIFVAAVTGVEIVAAITRRSRSGSISAIDAAAVCNKIRKDLQTEYQVLQITEDIIISGMTLAETHGLRGYDAIQLAAGCTLNSVCISSSLPFTGFVSADNELNVAASREGLSVENPNEQP